MTSPDEAGMARDLSKSSAEMAEQLKAVAVPCLLNRAACSLKLEQPREAIMDCHNVLQTDGTNTKALFRKGQAHVAVRVSYGVAIQLFKIYQNAAADRLILCVQWRTMNTCLQVTVRMIHHSVICNEGPSQYN